MSDAPLPPADPERPYRLLDAHLALLAGIFDLHREGILITDLAGKIVYYNEKQSRIDGIAIEEAVNNTICEVYNIEAEYSPTMHVLRTCRPTFDDVHFYRTRSGNLINSSCHIYPLFLEHVFCGALSFISEYSFLAVEALHPPEKMPIMAKSPGKEGSFKKIQSKSEQYTFANIIGKSALMVDAVKAAQKACDTPSAILLIGETGVGKEVFARSIHAGSARRGAPFVAINCAAVPETLLEGVLFGTAKGAFTGAVDKPGLLESAHGGTVFLDEIDSMAPGLQSKLLRVLQDLKVRRVGDVAEHAIDVKIISSIGKRPKECLDSGVLRKDLYYRLGVVRIEIPPLRKRMDDLALLAHFFIRKISRSLNVTAPLVNPEVMGMLYLYAWPGNVRELEHAIEACLNSVGNKGAIELDDFKKACADIFEAALLDKLGDGGSRRAALPLSIRGAYPDELRSRGMTAYAGRAAPAGAGMDRDGAPSGQGFLPKDVLRSRDLRKSRNSFETESICAALLRAGGNKSLAARLLGISPQLLYYKMKTLQIDADAVTAAFWE